MSLGRTTVVYELPPLVEAIFELFLSEGDDDREEVTFFEQFPRFISAPEPWASDIIEFSPGNDATRRSKQHGYRRWDAARQTSVLVGPTVFAFNIIPPYRSYAEYRPELEQLLRGYLGSRRSSEPQWIGHRYLNRIKVPGHASERLALYPKLPESLADRHPSFAMQLQTGEVDSGLVTTSIGLGSRDDDGAATYNLDLYARTTAPIANWDLEAMMRWHDQAHEAIREAFELSLTSTARSDFVRKDT